MTNLIFNSTQPRERRRTKLDSGWETSHRAVFNGSNIFGCARTEGNTDDVNSDVCHKPLKQLAGGEFSKAESAQVCSRGVSNDPDALNLMGVVRAEEHKALEAESFGRLLLPRQPISARISILQSCCNRLIGRKRCVYGRRRND